ncbi:Equilibrative nucleoside transporter like protein [Aduncisulcus paluster]|uniref:Equilibrative nucleoside transporter like protein n=7 Tax=Aduncisulcus paluster TaxID=2918883 RepID=A0ABQ5JXN5_9EUKA|nr:Equilibrative nucleoside transporter like protein [Aduncisulcus paluster]
MFCCKEEQQRRKDERNLFFIMLLLGTGSLLLFNAMITPVNFWTHTIPDFNVLFYISFAFNSQQLVGAFVMMKWGNKWSINKRVWISLIVELFSLVLIPSIPTKITNQTTALILVLIVTVITSNAAGILQSTVYSMGGSLGEHFSVAAMSGAGGAGLVMEIIRIITQAAMSRDDQIISGTIIYFILAGLILISCLIAFEVARRIPRAHQTILLMHGSVVGEIVTIDIQQDPEEPVIEVLSSPGEVMKKIWLDCISVFFVFFISLTLFPGVTNMVTSASFTDPDWFSIWNMSCFMVGDMIGRTLPRFVVLWGRNVNIAVIFIRLIFFPLFILQVKEILHNDFLLYSTMVVFSVSNGYTSSVAMMNGPTQVEKKDQPIAGTLMTVFLASGLFAGSLFALALNAILS